MPTHRASPQIADVLSPQGETALRAALADRGVAHFSGISSARALVDLARTVGTVVSHRDSDSNGITTIATQMDGSGTLRGRAAFTREALAPHTDSSRIATPPHLVFVACARAADTGGECLAVDARTVYHDLAREHPQALSDLCTPRTVLFGGAAGHLGAVFTRIDGDRIAVRLRLDDLATFSPLVARHLPVLRNMLQRHSFTTMLGPGEGYVLDNYRWLHGRGRFTGHRVFYRVHGNPSPPSALPRGFAPVRAGIHAVV